MHSSTIVIGLSVGLLSGLLLANSAQAVPMGVDVVAGDKVKLYDGPGSTGGGEFYVDVLGKGSSSSPYDFTTFCVEKDEFIAFNVAYTVASVSTIAMGGGVNTNSGDPLDSKTAYLYYQFVSGTLAGYTPTTADANLFQNLIWMYENEHTWTPTGKALQWHQDALANAGTGLWGVRVLNLVDANGKWVQDQLVYTGTPEPASILLLGSGLAALAYRRRRAS